MADETAAAAPQSWEPLSPLQIVRQLGQLTSDLHDTVEALRTADAKLARSTTNLNLAKAHAYVNASGTVQARQAAVTIQTADDAETQAVDEAVVRYLKARIRELETSIEVGRSYGAAVRAEFSALGYTDGRGR